MYRDIKINGRDFLEFLINESPSNMRFIRGIRFNKKSISITIDREDRGLIFNSLFTEHYLYKELTAQLRIYIQKNGIEYPQDTDYIRGKFRELKINYK